jgi:PTS system fructose-specific IIC component
MLCKHHLQKTEVWHNSTEMYAYPLLSEPIDNVYATLAVLLVLGAALGYVSKRCHLPSLTGNILAGLLLGPVFGIVDTLRPTVAAQLEPLTNLALSLIAIGIGSHLRFAVLHNALKRILLLAGMGAIVVPLVVFTALWTTMVIGGYGAGLAGKVALCFGVLAIATSPATVVHLIKETQSRGLLVKTLIAVVVCGNVFNLLLFELFHSWLFKTTVSYHALRLAAGFIGAIALGGVAALVLEAVWNRVYSRQRMVTLAFAALIVVYGIAVQFGLSPVLANLALGITIANVSHHNRIFDVFEDFEGVVYCIFFGLVGTHASFDQLGTVGLLATVFLLARLAGNLATVWLSGLFYQMPVRVRRYLGLALTPQAGITVGLVVGLESLDVTGAIAPYVTPVVLLAITVSEIVGPVLLRLALRYSGEEGHARPRLIDFLQEEYITVDLVADDRVGVIAELVDLLFKTHPSLRKVNKMTFLQQVLSREREGSTAVGQGVAIPHAPVAEGNKIMGVMAVSRQGIRWATSDGRAVHVIVLLATPPSYEQYHVSALSTLSRLFRHRSIVDGELQLASSPHEVYETLVDEEFESLNEVLAEELGGEQPAPSRSSAYNT